jgi:hypothetical protein
VVFQINTVFSLFNYPTLAEFYNYLKSKNIVQSGDWYNSLYLAVHPSYYSAKSLPKELKQLAKSSAQDLVKSHGNEFQGLTRLVNDAISFADHDNTWKDNKTTFFKHTRSQDRLRNEDFFKTFPELARLQDLED